MSCFLKGLVEGQLLLPADLHRDGLHEKLSHVLRIYVLSGLPAIQGPVRSGGPGGLVTKN